MNKKTIINIVYWSVMTVLFFTLVSFSSKMQSERICSKINRKVDKEFQRFFIDEDDVMSIISEGNKKVIKGLNKEAIDIEHLESLLKENQYVKDARVSINHEGTLDVYVEQNVPVARIFEKERTYYIDQNGNKLPLSSKYSARVPIILNNMAIVDKKNEFFASNKGESYIFLLNYIRNNEFWSKQITQLDINDKGEVEMQMQVGKQKVEFGLPNDVESKFYRLNVFIKKIMPNVGWNKYNKVSLKYKNQLVCE